MALRCIKAFSAYEGGRPRVVRDGQLVEESDPIVAGREAHFETVDAHLARRPRAVEQATADPGEPRTVTSPAEPDEPASASAKAAARRPRRNSK
ncbi:hypothetical protein [Streptomyces odontomachi]|uniref:hypothetical protein n=1 Tax=Streptomyces odontomachi TaxID=2944940 RepID=UPI00210DFE89|nr:hypothetical protein [Streptomyces sp. ODS25]